ncbi:MAG: hypothetical protein E6J91_10685 [Deltaproteobacteria bacterium]|nr:MAG: hypothetical protein E6J91_10685 [Deltaproteobacteria bacterium]
MAHRFHFFRAGGVDQVSLRDGADLLALAELDQKLWSALAMPTRGVDIDPETLALLDVDSDGRLRVQDILAAIAWARQTFRQPGDLLTSSAEVHLSAIADAKIVAAARRMLLDLGKKDAPAISVADTVAITKAFSETVLNGDGIVIPASTDDLELRRVIEDAIACVGSVTDRSGKPGIDQALADRLFAEVDAYTAWLAGRDAATALLGPATAMAAAAFAEVRAKMEDYFARCKIAAFDPRAGAALAGQEPALVALADRMLSDSDEQLAQLPLAAIDPAARLPLSGALNPAWAARIHAFAAVAVPPILGARDGLTPADVETLATRLAPYRAWFEARPATKVDTLADDWILRLGEPDLRKRLAELIASEAALADEYAQITAVGKAVRMQRDFGRILRNFVNFSDFYARQDGAFQIGTLYLDARALHLCVPVVDAAKHGALAGASDACLLYCDITRQGETRQIAAALTNGDVDNVFVGRNGVFYDREGRDWDAAITKVINNPISVRAAFWSPYKKLFKTVEDTVAKRAQAAEARSAGVVGVVGANIGNAGKDALGEPAGAAGAAAPAGPAAPAGAPRPMRIDLGTVAALGVAIGGVGTLVGALLANLFGLGKWLPVGVIALLLMISGPSMLLAWLKLRRRNLGPILDANGWAINTRARINVAFGAAMTELPRLPAGAKRSLDDPFADRRTPWKLYLLLAIVLVLFGTWYLGKLDPYLPDAARSTSVLGDLAPSAKRVDQPARPTAQTPTPAAPAK